jgi:Cof subfamily protein (haloacid dehalogenase superfamily)
MESAHERRLPFRLLALDLDNTLLRSDQSISERTKSAVKRAEAAGATVVLASGRIPAAMYRFSRILGLHKKPGYLVCNNGALILESHTGKLVHEALLEPGIALAIYELADAEGFPVQIYIDDVMYVSRRNEYSDADQKLIGVRQVVADNFRALIEEGCHRLIITGDPTRLVTMEGSVRAQHGNGITMFTSQRYFLEILPRGTDKGSALAILAGIMGISASEAIAVGDSMNDEAMICWAGIGAAMANGDERIKRMADYVTERTNNGDGVAEVIDKYFI